MATKLNFHIHKFSYGTAEPAKSNNIAWTHLVSDDLVVLLNQDQISGKLELRVIERTDVLVSFRFHGQDTYWSFY